MKKGYDIFISYRRDGGESTAKILRDKMNLNEVVVVVPMKSEIPKDLMDDFERMQICVLSMSEFVHKCSLFKRRHKM